MRVHDQSDGHGASLSSSTVSSPTPSALALAACSSSPASPPRWSGSPAEATKVRVRGGRTVLSDGPFAKTKEQIAGHDVLDCADLDEAIDIASKHPVARFGMLELRLFWTG